MLVQRPEGSEGASHACVLEGAALAEGIGAEAVGRRAGADGGRQR